MPSSTKLDWDSGLVKHLGIRFVETEKDRIVAELEIRPELLTTTGALHGGTLMAFADTIGAAGTVVNLEPGQNTATLESKTNFFAAAFNARRRLLSATRRFMSSRMRWTTSRSLISWSVRKAPGTQW